MVIFHSYVSLPEGITSDYGSFQIIPNHSKSRSPFLLIVLTSFPSFLLKPPLWLTQHLCWLTPHLCWWSRCFWWFWCFVMLWFLAFSSHNFSIISISSERIHHSERRLRRRPRHFLVLESATITERPWERGASESRAELGQVFDLRSGR